MTLPFFLFSRTYNHVQQVPDTSVVEFHVNNRWVPANTIIQDAAWLALWHPNTSPDFVAGNVPGNGLGNGVSTSAAGIDDAGSGLADDNLAETVRGRGAAVLAARKLSSAMSAANAVAAHVGDWLGPGVKCGEEVYRAEEEGFTHDLI